MSTPILRLVPITGSGAGDARRELSSHVQLSLFDVRPVRRVLCLPMADIHGSIFSRAVSLSRPGLVVDVRAYPYFDLAALSRRIALRLLDEAPSRYVHAAIDLRPPANQAARWNLRRLADAAFGGFVSSLASDERPIVVLVDRISEIEVLDEALRGMTADREMPWMVELHGAMARAGRL